MRKPSVKTLANICENPKQARAIFEMTRAQLAETKPGKARIAACHNAPKTYDVAGFHGLESAQATNGAFVDYLNAGDAYSPTIIYWNGRYRVQCFGDFVETMARQGVIFQ